MQQMFCQLCKLASLQSICPMHNKHSRTHKKALSLNSPSLSLCVFPMPVFNCPYIINLTSRSALLLKPDQICIYASGSATHLGKHSIFTLFSAIWKHLGCFTPTFAHLHVGLISGSRGGCLPQQDESSSVLHCLTALIRI